MQNLDHFLLIVILTYLDPEDVLACELQSSRFRHASVCHDSLWLVHCDRVWKRTGFSSHWVPPCIPLLERIRSVCSIAQMRKALASYETTALVEKRDFVVLLRAKLLFGPAACSRGPRGGYVPPTWAGEKLNDGKAAWAFAKKESSRKAAIESELLLGGGRWDLRYKQQPQPLPFDLQFYGNHEMSASSHGDQVSSRVLAPCPSPPPPNFSSDPNASYPSPPTTTVHLTHSTHTTHAHTHTHTHTAALPLGSPDGPGIRGHPGRELPPAQVFP